MRTTTLGHSDLDIGVMGLGCMGMSEFYGTANEAESIATIHRALEVGINFFDTADIYGRGDNEKLVGKALKDRRDRAVICTKFGIVRDPSDTNRSVNGSPAYLRKQCEASLRNLGIETIDLYYQHRVDPGTPIEETIGALAELMQEGKIRYIGLSEAPSEIIRRAHAMHPISALQTEYSVWSRFVEEDILATCRELGITFVGYSPLGRGMLAGRFQTYDDLEAGDWRRTNPRFAGEAFENNRAAAQPVFEVAEAKGVTPAQVALAWVYAQGEDIVTIPGTKRRTYLEQNVAALEIQLTPDELAILDVIAPQIIGARYG